MCGRSALLALSLAACGSNRHPATDAGVDVSVDGDAAPVCPTTLLTGGTPVEAQGWSVEMQPPATVTCKVDYVQLETTTTSGQTKGGQLLLYRPGALEAGQPFKLQVVMRVERVAPHNPLDSAAAILGSYTPMFGTMAERSQMLALDTAAIGWGDMNAFTVAVPTGDYHTYELSVDAGGMAQVSVDGTATGLTHPYTSNGTIAIGDQTNEANLDSTLQIRSVTRLCL